MIIPAKHEKAVQQYAMAHTTHYKTKDLLKAYQQYREILASYPGAKEAEYARMQIRNIVDSVVPDQEVDDCTSELALAHLKQAEKAATIPSAVDSPEHNQLSQGKSARYPEEPNL